MSRDLLCGACRKLHKRCQRPDYPKKLHYGDELYATGIGWLTINDVMGSYTTQRVRGKLARIPIKNHIDIWVPSFKAEKSFHKKWKGKAVELYKIEVKEKP